MNIFVLDEDPKKCAEYHCDKHVLKMIIESSQMLSTAHRYLDGKLIKINNKKHWQLNDYRENILYKCTHYNHPTTKWVRENSENYKYLFELLTYLHKEYEKRYNKIHSSKRILKTLSNVPNNIQKGKFFNPPQAMPDIYKNKNTVIAYRNYYLKDKIRFANWKLNNKPSWFKEKK